MNKIIFSIGLLLISLASFAQQSDKTPQQKAQEKTQRLTGELSLTADQSTKVQTIFLQQETQAATIRSKYASADDKSGMRAEMKPIHEQTDNSLKQVLTADQYTKYQTIKEQHKSEHGGHRNNP